MRLRISVLAVTALMVQGCKGDEPAPPAPAPGPITVPSGMPVTDELGVEEDALEAGTYVVDEDALLQAALLALSGELPLERTAGGRLRVQAAPPGSVLARAGLKVADEIVTIAGESTKDDAALLHAYATLREQRRFVLVVERNGERVRLTYRVTGLSRPRKGVSRPRRARRRDGARLALPAPSSSSAAPSPSASSAPRRRSSARWPPGAVNQVGPGRYTVSRKAWDAILADQAALMRSVRVVPAKRDGKPAGVKLFGLRRSSWLRELGFENGDLLLRLNGFDISDPSAALEAYGKAKEATSFRVDLERRGRPLTLTYDMVP